jgi:hypothetical protein
MDLCNKGIVPFEGEYTPNDGSDQSTKIEKKSAHTPSDFIKPSESKVE